MKVFGWILLVCGILNFLLAVFTGSDYPDQVGGKFAGAFMCLTIGAFLLWRAKKKKEEQEDKDKFERGA